jgi:hypothetical protein
MTLLRPHPPRPHPPHSGKTGNSMRVSIPLDLSSRVTTLHSTSSFHSFSTPSSPPAPPVVLFPPLWLSGTWCVFIFDLRRTFIIVLPWFSPLGLRLFYISYSVENKQNSKSEITNKYLFHVSCLTLPWCVLLVTFQVPSHLVWLNCELCFLTHVEYHILQSQCLGAKDTYPFSTFVFIMNR